jgi:hypothetical protein
VKGLSLFVGCFRLKRSVFIMKRNLSKGLVIAGAFLLTSCNLSSASSNNSISDSATSSIANSTGISSSITETSPSSSVTSVSSSQPDTIYVVSFHYGDGSVRTVNVTQGATVENPGADTTLTAARFDGWYLNDSLYDFSALVNSNLTLVSKSTAYVDIPCTVYFDAGEDYKYSDGLFSKYGPFFTGYYQQSITLSLISETLSLSNLSYTLEKEDGTVLMTLTSQTPFVLSEEKLVITASGTVKKVTVSYDLTGLSNTNGIEGFEADVRNGCRLSSLVPSASDSSQAFFGWKIDGDIYDHRYLPGETIPEEDLAKYSNSACDSIVLKPLFNENIVEVSTWADLLAVDPDAVVSLSADIDAGGEDTITGMGNGEFDGILFGNGHTIRNFTSNVNDDAGNNTGLIDTASHAQFYDLTLDGVSISAHGAFGAAALVGECDDYLIMHNVSVRNMTITNLDTKKYPNVDQVYGIHGGIGALVGATGSGEFVGCSVSSFNSSCIPNWIEGTGNDEKSLRLGGLIGYESSMDGGNHGLLIKNCTVESSNLNLENYLGGQIGGLVGGSDGSTNGTEIIDNIVRNVVIEAKNADNQGENNSAMKLGGLAGELDLYSQNKGPYYTSDNKLSVPVAVNRNNVIDCTLLYNGSTASTSDTTTVMVGGIAGDFVKHINGDATNLNFTECDRNVVSGTTIGVTPTGSNSIFAGGQFGDIDCDGGNNQYTIFTNNYVDANITVNPSHVLHTTVAGFAGGAYAEAEAGIYFDSNVVKGTIKGPGVYTNTSNLSTFLDTAGFLGRIVTADADILVNRTYVNVVFDASTYASIVSYSEIAFDGLGDEVAPTITVTNNGVNDATVPGTVNDDMFRLISVSATSSAISRLDFSTFYWRSDTNGEPLLSTMRDE